MLVEPSAAMTEFPKVADGDLFMTFINKMQVFGMKIKLDRKAAVLHLNGGEPKVVDEFHFVNLDVLVLKDSRVSLSGNDEGKSWKSECPCLRLGNLVGGRDFHESRQRKWALRR